MIFGLTGGIATGKSTVAQMLRKRGAVVIDADQVAREVVEPGTEGLAQIVANFGHNVLDESGRLNRAQLGKLIFHDAEARQQLNRLLHPLIVDKMKRDTDKVRQTDGRAVIIWDVPLLIEAKMTPLVDEIILVYVPETIQLARLMARNRLSQQEAEARMRAQLSIEQKREWADYVIDNSGTLEETEKQVQNVWNELCLKSG